MSALPVGPRNGHSLRLSLPILRIPSRSLGPGRLRNACRHDDNPLPHLPTALRCDDQRGRDHAQAQPRGFYPLPKIRRSRMANLGSSGPLPEVRNNDDPARTGTHDLGLNRNRELDNSRSRRKKSPCVKLGDAKRNESE